MIAAPKMRFKLMRTVWCGATAASAGLYRPGKARLAGGGKNALHATLRRCTAKVQIRVAFRQEEMREGCEAACG
ncbi:hypothetical protein AYM40_06420 [Paraburkholderia phytofirmans OLGA172]|uniref:Uncharacterized protein n=1 Tax=Paraburkholderia phytofirmans OLGA172 TaxID=1417228 RepID=A0A167VVM6_9BURK|nr:hypothetical protein AYM40_06420 [Paraburkholderia phytofirmans OLGA172]